MKSTRGMIRVLAVYALIVPAAGLVQTTWPAGLTIMGTIPDLLLVLAILSGYLFGRRDGLVIGLAAGFIRDALAGRSMGLGMLLLMYAGLLASVTFRKLFRRNIPLGLVLIILTTVLYHMLITLMTFIMPVIPDVAYSLPVLLEHMWKILPGSVLGNVLAGIPMILLLYFAGPYRRGSRNVNDEQTIAGESLWQTK